MFIFCYSFTLLYSVQLPYRCTTSIEKVHDHIRNFPFLVPYCTENASNLYLLHCHAAGTIGMYLYNVLYNVHVLYIQYKGSRSFLLRKPHLEHKESMQANLIQSRLRSNLSCKGTLAKKFREVIRFR